MEVRGQFLPGHRGLSVTLDKGTIASFEEVAPELELPFLARGFFDIQVNGYRGIDYSSESLVKQDVRTVVDLLAPSGTTRHLPTIITNAQERIERNLSTIAGAIESEPGLAYRVPGIHVEGPYISREDGPRGAHDRQFVRNPDLAEIERWIEASSGLLRIVTLAPELPGATDAIEFLTKRGVRVALGHHAGGVADITAAAGAGATLSTHLGNGSHAELPRLKNYLWEQLAEDRLNASIIADGFHLPESVLKVFSRAKGLNRLILVSDVAPIGGKAPGVYRWGNIEIEIHDDQHIGLRGTPFLAGAGHLLNRDIAVFCRATGCSVEEGVALATDAPQRFLSDADSPCFPSEGDPADLVVFGHENGGDELKIMEVHAPDKSYKGASV